MDKSSSIKKQEESGLKKEEKKIEEKNPQERIYDPMDDEGFLAIGPR